MSKPVAIVLLVAALAVAGLAGGYLATHNKEKSKDEIAGTLVPLDPPDAGAPSSAAGAGGAAAQAGKGGGGSRPPRRGGAGGAAQGGEAVVIGAQSTVGPLPSTRQGSGAVPLASGAPLPEDVEIPSGEILEIELQSPVSSETAKVEDRVEARITKEVRVGATIAIPAMTKLLGSISQVDKGGRISETAKVGVRFHTLVMMPGPVDVPVVIDEIVKEGPPHAGDSKKKIAGGAAAGAGIGWMKGGVMGAITGAAVGGGAGTAAKVVEGRKAAEVPAGARARIELRAPVHIIVRR